MGTGREDFWVYFVRWHHALYHCHWAGSRLETLMGKHDQETLISDTDTCLRSLACSKAYLTGNICYKHIQWYDLPLPLAAVWTILHDDFLSAQKQGSQKTYGECNGTSKRWKQDTTGPMVHPSEITSPFNDFVKMWMYTLWTPMNIYKQTVFREWLLWWKTWKTLTEKGKIPTFSLLHWAILPGESLWVPWLSRMRV